MTGIVVTKLVSEGKKRADAVFKRCFLSLKNMHVLREKNVQYMVLYNHSDISFEMHFKCLSLVSANTFFDSPLTFFVGEFSRWSSSK